MAVMPDLSRHLPSRFCEGREETSPLATPGEVMLTGHPAGSSCLGDLPCLQPTGCSFVVALFLKPCLATREVKALQMPSANTSLSVKS